MLKRWQQIAALGLLGLILVLVIGRPPHAGWERNAAWTPLLEEDVPAAFSDTLAALEGRPLRLNGFMIASQGKASRRFLLSAYPKACPTCIPAGPESLVAVEANEPVAYQHEPVRVRGTFQLDRSGRSGVWYRLTNAVVRAGE